MDNNIYGYNFKFGKPSYIYGMRPYKFSASSSDIKDSVTFSYKIEKNNEEKNMRKTAEEYLIKSGDEPQKAKKQIAKMSNEQLMLASELIHFGAPPYFVYTDITKYSISRMNKCLNLVKNGFDFNEARTASKADIDFDKIFSETKDGYKYRADETDDDKIMIFATKSHYNPETGIVSVIEKAFRSDGKNTVSRTEYDKPDITINDNGEYLIDGEQTNCKALHEEGYIKFKNGEYFVDNLTPGYTLDVVDRTHWEINGEHTNCEVKTPSRTHYIGSGRTLETEYKNDKNDVRTQTEILPDADGNPSEVIFTKQSDKLPGAFETVKYRLANYDEDIDVISEIKKGTLQGGKVLSQVTENDDGSITLKENFTRNGCNIKREYTESQSGMSYSYVIDDENGNNLMNLQRSYTLNDDGTSTTEINGKKYIVSFDDETKNVTVTDSSGSETKIDLGSIIVGDDTNELWELAKKLPSDSLFTINNHITTLMRVSKESPNPGIIAGILICEPDSFIIKHELGHAEDYQENWICSSGDIRRSGDISSDKELNDIYKKEVEAFCDEYTEVTQDIMRYFMPYSNGSQVKGIAEVVAEANALFGMYGSDAETVTTRGQYLVRYFPRTTAKIAELTGYNK